MPAGSSHFAGRTILGHGFAADDGRATEALADSLTAFAADPTDPWEVLRALAVSRLLVPVVAVAEQTATDATGRTVDKQTAMATVLIENSRGQRSMLAFTCLDSLRTWRSDARPVPVDAISAAHAAVQDDAGALLIDVAGPIAFSVTGPELSALAESRVIPVTTEPRTRLHRALAVCLEGEASVIDARLEPSDGRLQLTLVVDPGLTADGYHDLRGRVVGRISQLADLRHEFPAGVHLRIVAPDVDLGDTPRLVRRGDRAVRDDSPHDHEHDS